MTTSNQFFNEYLIAFKEKKKIKGKYIWGEPGIGKTHLVKLLLIEIDNYNSQLTEKIKALKLKIDELEKVKDLIWKEADKKVIDQMESKTNNSNWDIDSVSQKLSFKFEYCSKNSKYVEVENEIEKLNNQLNNIGKKLTYEFLEISYFIKSEKDKFGTTVKLTNLQKYIEADILILDDIGKQQFCVWSLLNVIYPIVDIRYNNNQITFFTSNHPVEKLQKKMCLAKDADYEDIKAIISRIKGLTEERNMKGRDRRQDDW